jgi:cobalamin biosynthesis Mg chelatase CobN
MEQPEDPQGRYHDQIEAARRLLQQKEDWADRAEWEVTKTEDGWRVLAWRVEHPENKGASRYLPWGYSEIDLDSRMVAVHYHRKG